MRKLIIMALLGILMGLGACGTTGQNVKKTGTQAKPGQTQETTVPDSESEEYEDTQGTEPIY